MGMSTQPVCHPVTTSLTMSSTMVLGLDAGLLAGARMKLMDHSSSSRKRLPSLWYLQADVTPTSSLLSTSRDKELETDSSSIPVRFVLVVKLERMLALEMVGHHWCVSPTLEGGQLWVW